MVDFKGRRGGDIYGGERPRRGKISLKSRRGGLGEENRSIFPRRGALARNCQEFFLAGVTSFSPGVTRGHPGQADLSSLSLAIDQI